MGGKTTLGVAILASAQRSGHIVGIKDYEGSFKDKKWPQALGLDLNACLYDAPTTLEEGADSLNEMILNFKNRVTKDKRYKDKMMLWLVDSAPAMVPQAELEEKTGKRNFGLQANLFSSWLRKLNTIIKRTNISIIFINQERVKIGAKAFEKKWKTACGEALKYYAHFRVRVLQASTWKLGEKIIGKEHRFIVEKNKVSAPDEMGYFYSSNGNCPEVCKLGFGMSKTLFKEALEQGIIIKQGKVKWTCSYFPEEERGLTEKEMLDKLSDDSVFESWLLSEFQRRIGN